MSNCQNCFNGCTETVADQCVKYTGIDVPTLGIQTGDPLPVVENALITFLTSTLTGVGVKIDLSSIDVCTVVQKYLPTCGELNILELSKALVQAACDIQEQVDANTAELAALNADYTIECLTGVTSSSDTHAIVQAVITKLCTIDTNLTSLTTEVEEQYVRKTELCTEIENCVNNNNGTALASAKMLPYSPIPYYGEVSGYPTVSDGFSITGAGYGYWLNVYICNGQNPGVPDLRGRVTVGSTDMYGSNWPTTGQTQPGLNGNPTYTYKSAVGQNVVTLSLPQIPAHNHAGSTATTAISPNPHSHTGTAAGPYLGAVITGGGGFDGSNANLFRERPFVTNQTSLTATTTLTMQSQGNNEAHMNYQPGLAVYYLIYIPA
jgi:microcystin-dependent protein